MDEAHIMDEAIEHHRYEVTGSNSGSPFFVTRVTARDTNEAIMVACQRMYGKNAWFHRDSSIRTDHLRTDDYDSMYGQIFKSLRTKRNNDSGSTSLTDRMRIEVQTLRKNLKSIASSPTPF